MEEHDMSRSVPLDRMRSPPHPGSLLREDVLKPLGLSVTRAAEALGVSRPNLSQLLLNERIDLSPEMALKLEAAFALEADMLLGMQTDHSLTRARQAEITAKVRRLRPSSAHDTLNRGSG
jgi:antitoxin HigA-1